jgi:hypothetical protein
MGIANCEKMEDPEEVVVRGHPGPARIEVCHRPHRAVARAFPAASSRSAAALEIGAVERILFERRLVQTDPDAAARQPRRRDRSPPRGAAGPSRASEATRPARLDAAQAK